MVRRLNDRPWRKDEVEIVRLAHLTRTASDVAAELNRTLSAVQTRGSLLGIKFLNRAVAITSLDYDTKSKTVFPDRLEYARFKRPRDKIQYLLSKKPEQLTAAEASVAHLFDLRLAGYKPGFGELVIRPDDGGPRHFTPEPCMSYRSPALMEG
jgi:hypothetical protein